MSANAPLQSVTAPANDSQDPVHTIPVASGRSNRTQNAFPPTSPNKKLETVSVILSANGTQIVPLAGDRFFVLKSTAPAMIALPGGPPVPYLPGQGLHLRNSAFTALTISNPSKTASIKLTIALGFDDYDNFSMPLLDPVINEGLTLITAGATPQPVSTVDLYFQTGFFFAYKALVKGTPTNNGAAVAIGKSSTYQPDTFSPASPIFKSPCRPENG